MADINVWISLYNVTAKDDNENKTEDKTENSLQNLMDRMKDLLPKLREQETKFIIVLDAVNEVRH